MRVLLRKLRLPWKEVTNHDDDDDNDDDDDDDDGDDGDDNDDDDDDKLSLTMLRFDVLLRMCGSEN